MGDFVQVLIFALVLSIDAFSVSIALGMKTKKHSFIEASTISASFGIFQAVMPLIGWLIGNALKDEIESATDIIAFVLLSAIGIKIIYESIKTKDEDNKKLTFSTLMFLSVATSIDALIVGTTLALLSLPIILSAILIGITTFALCIGGYYSGNSLGKIFQKNIEIIGGVILILLGLKFLIF